MGDITLQAFRNSEKTGNSANASKMLAISLAQNTPVLRLFGKDETAYGVCKLPRDPLNKEKAQVFRPAL